MNKLSREVVLESLKVEEYDILVIGGGATGSYIALDSTSRGLKTAMIEKQDFSEGTSSKSTKLIHGGVRYLEKAAKQFSKLKIKSGLAQFNVVKDALYERHYLIKNSPHISKPLETVLPTYSLFEKLYYGVGLWGYEKVSGKRSIGKSKILSKEAALEKCSFLRPDGLSGGISYYDGQFIDSRLNVDIVTTAVKRGADITNYLEVIDIIKENGKIAGVIVSDRINNTEFKIKAKSVINATGAYTDIIRRLDDNNCKDALEVSSGIHIILNKKFTPPTTGFLIPKTEDNRVIFVLPWNKQTMIGTTDEKAIVEDHPKATEQDINYLIRYYNKYSREQANREDVQSVWNGLRPLVKAASEGTADLVRDHVIFKSDSGLITITGGKWTAVRRMAYDAVNYTITHHDLKPKNDCITKEISLIDGHRFREDGYKALVEKFGIDEDIAIHLNQFYAGHADKVCEIAKEESLSQRLNEEYPYIEAEVAFGARYELAQSINDVLTRRTTLSLVNMAAADSATNRVADILQKELSWDDTTKQEHISFMRDRLDNSL